MTDLTIVEQEIVAIEDEMRRDLTGYFKDQAKQDRYESLLRVKQSGGSAPTPSSAGNDGLEPASLNEARSFLAATPAGQRLLRQWGAAFGENLQAAQAEAGAILAGMSETEQQELMDMVDDLSPAAFTALMNKLAKRNR